MPDDYYVSQYSGEEIDERLTAAHNAVRYDAAQTLTDAQKAQARNNISAMQGIESTDHPGCYYVLNGSAVEWINPPMQLGIEYRTTERYQGKPVYAKLVNFGALPNSTTARVAHGVENIGYRIFVGGDANGEPLATRSGISYITAGSSDIVIATSSNLSAITAHVLLKYTKNTD